MVQDVSVETRLAQEASDIRRKEAIQQELIANVSHELRTPIAAIRGFTETLLHGAIEDKRNRKRFLSIINRHAERLGRIVESILHLSALDAGHKKPRPEFIGLREFCDKFLQAYQPLLDTKGLKTKLSIPAKLRVKADWENLDQVLQNLVGNAIKYNRALGDISVSAKARGRFVAISIADTGVGISKEYLPKIFQRFNRAGQSRDVEGAGLGLSIAQKIVEGWGGAITVKSSPRGSTFTFTVPGEK
jgi:two-component system phosphate regulon sensor histidine kinase PhoR